MLKDLEEESYTSTQGSHTQGHLARLSHVSLVGSLSWPSGAAKLLF